ncbi:hypothetical protein MHU86_3351 [Fragilaria crotonensis]|nr:hypothetical protein MHU86_3351 [Fragilaria crotonensis]
MTIWLLPLLLLLAVVQVNTFAPSARVHSSTAVSVSPIMAELEQVWSDAARSGVDAVLTTADLVKDRSFDYKRRAFDRIHTILDKGDVEHEAKYDADYRAELAQAEVRFLKAVSKAEEQLARSIQRSEADYDRFLKQEKHWTSDVVLRAKTHFIQSTAAAEELFLIAVEKAELGFEEAKVKADSVRDRQMEYFLDYGEDMHDIMAYLSVDFSNLIAF